MGGYEKAIGSMDLTIHPMMTPAINEEVTYRVDKDDHFMNTLTLSAVDGIFLYVYFLRDFLYQEDE